MSLVLLTGDHARHFFLAETAWRSGLLSGLVIERREAHRPEPPPGLPESTRLLFEHHFARRAAAEERFFSSAGRHWQGVETLTVEAQELNGAAVRDFIARLEPRLLLSYGVHKLQRETLEAAPGLRWNLHGGLSPTYRGVATHFWPSYLLEPQMTGVTLHELTDRLDAGPIVHQTAASLIPGDGLHDLACRALLAFCEELPEVLARLIDDSLEPARPQSGPGRLWRAQDWRPAHLHPIYDYYQDRIVDRYLAGEFGTVAPPALVRQL